MQPTQDAVDDGPKYRAAGSVRHALRRHSRDFCQDARLRIREVGLDRKHIDKIIAVALSPGAYEEEAVAALRKAREIVKRNPTLAHPEPPSPQKPPSTPPPKPEHSIEYRVSKIRPFWLGIFLSNLSEKAYGLGLRSKFSCDFTEIPTAVDIRCDGSKEACDLFVEHLHCLINYINSQPRRRYPRL